MQPLFLPGPVSDIKAIREESEPASPEGYPQSSRTSYLTHLLKSSPPNERIGPAETNDGTPGPSERDSLLPKRRASSSRRDYNAIHGEDIEDDIEAQGRSHSVIPKISVAQVLIWPKAKVGAVFKNESWNSRMVWEKAVKEPVGYIPAVALGLLLNLLDGLSYGQSIGYFFTSIELMQSFKE